MKIGGDVSLALILAALALPFLMPRARRYPVFRLRHAATGTGTLATMAPGLSFAMAAQLAYPDRQSVAVVADGGFAMLMAKLSTAGAQNLPVNIILLKDNSLAEVKFEQKEMGDPEYGCDLPPIDFVAFAKACGADAFHRERPDEVRPANAAALGSPRPALVEAVVDAEERPTKPDELRA